MLFAAALAAAGAPRHDAWKVLGPGGGGTMYAPVISPHDSRHVLVHCDMTGTYLSRDGGDSWRMFNLRGRTRFYLFDPVDPNVIYVRTVALFRSVNRGRTWALVHPDPATVTGIQMPDDHAGERLLSTGRPAGTILALAVDPANSKTLYGAFPDGLYLSTDWGKNWKKTGELPFTPRAVYVDPRSPKSDRTLYLTGPNRVAVREGGHWRTHAPPPGVANFTDVSAGFPRAGGRLVVYATAASGAFVSRDGGETWRVIVLPGLKFKPNFPAVAASFHHPEVAYLSYDNGRAAPERMFGIARTSDTGRTWSLVWTQADTNPPRNREAWMTERNGAGWGRNPDNLGVAPADPNLCFGTDSMRTMRSRDGGRTWEAVYSVQQPGGGWTSTGLDVTTCYGVHFDPFDPKHMLISYTDIGQSRSEDGGRSWLLSTQGIPREWRNTTYWVVYDPEVRGRLWGVMSYVHDLPRPKMWQGRSPSTYVGGICRSDDGARNWNCFPGAIPNTAPTHILMDPASPVNARVLYVAAFGRGVYKSADDGKTWTARNEGIAGPEPLAWRLACDAKGTLYLVVARRSQDGSFGNESDGALYRSTDGAARWSRIELPRGVNGPNGLAIDPGDPQRLYLAAWGRRTAAGAVDGGIFLSEDGGASWRNVLARDQHVYDVTIDPRDPRILYACGFSSSAWRSTDRGLTWRRIRGYNFKWGHRVIPDPVDPSRIYITTFGGSVWHGPAAGDPKAPEDIETPVLRFSGDW